MATKKLHKTKNASRVLKLMDKDWSYTKAVNYVSKRYKVPRYKLEKQLNPFI